MKMFEMRWTITLFAGAIILLLPGAARAQDVGAQGIGSQVLTCSSDNGRRQSCPSQYNPISNAQLMKQMGGARCVQGRTWGFDARAIWVDSGCRGQFRVYGWSGGGGGSGNSTTVRCRSMDGGFRHCPVNGWVRGADLTQQLGNANCAQGRTWGWDNNGVWVDRQCKGDFRVWIGGRPHGRSTVVRCDANLVGRKRCPLNGFITGALVEEQYSGAPCIQGTSWGFDSRGLWAERGCRADFRVWFSR
jgi:hypothetical protein